MGTILELPGFYVYPWQNRLTEARACVEYVGYHIAAEIAVGDNDLKLDVVLPPGIDEIKARAKFLEVLNQSGFTLFLQTPAGDVVTPPAPPSPTPPWWAGLKFTDPKTKIYSNVAAAQVYFSGGPDIAPALGNRAVLSTGLPWTLPGGRGVEVWAAPVAGSEWICVAILANRALWVSGHDMRATP